MKDYLKLFYKGIQQLVETLISVVAILLFSPIKVAIIISKMKSDRGCDAFVLGNGPSLKEILCSQERLNEVLAGESIVMNSFANSDYFKKIRPRYYILLDPIFFDDNNLRNNESDRSVITSINNVDWEMTLFLVHGHNSKVLNNLITNPLIKIVKYNATRVIGYKWFQNMIYRLNLGIPSSRNVIIPALMVMMNIGYKKLYLYGAEFSWTKTIDVDPQNNRVFINDKHFYNANNVQYMSEGWYKWYLEAIVDMLNGMDQIAKYARMRSVKIINRTKGSFIDAFEYENPDTIVS